jgi:hypothetical protein
VKISSTPSTPFQPLLAATDSDLEASDSDDSEHSDDDSEYSDYDGEHFEVEGPVSCPNDCDKLFDTYAEAVTHSYSKNCPKRDLKRQISCPWKSIVGCTKKYASLGHMRAHYKVHHHDSRTPYPCRQNCGTRWPDLYLLAYHEMYCGVSKRVQRLHRITSSSNSPAVIMIARCSNKTAQSWKGDDSTVIKGLPKWFKGMLQDYQGLSSDNRAAVLHAGEKVRSAHFPALSFDYSAKANAVKRFKKRAFQFTESITKDLMAAKENDPVVVSIGSDAWGADPTMLCTWLLRVPPFRLIVRHPFIRLRGVEVKMSEKYLRWHKDAWWCEYKSQDIQAVLQGEQIDNEAVVEFVNFMTELQRQKDRRRETPMIPGRNQQRYFR